MTHFLIGLRMQTKSFTGFLVESENKNPFKSGPSFVKRAEINEPHGVVCVRLQKDVKQRAWIVLRGLTFMPSLSLTYSVLRLVHPVVIIKLLLVSVSGVKAGVRVRVRLAAVDDVELVLAVEYASALAGEVGHAEPA